MSYLAFHELSFFVWVISLCMCYLSMYEWSFLVWVISLSMSYFNIYELFPFAWVISPCMSYLFCAQDAVPGREVEESDQGGISSDGGQRGPPARWTLTLHCWNCTNPCCTSITRMHYKLNISFANQMVCYHLN